MPHDEQQIRQLVTNWIDSTKRGDIQAVLDLMTEDVVFLLPGRPPMIGRATFEAASKAQSASPDSRPQIDGVSEIQEIQVHGDWAFMWTKLKVTVTPPGGAPSMTRAGHTLSVLKKQNGKWLMARDANMLAPVQDGGNR
jgi:uncharacterized protein (TIGR02246 family)